MKSRGPVQARSANHGAMGHTCGVHMHAVAVCAPLIPPDRHGTVSGQQMKERGGREMAAHVIEFRVQCSCS